MSREIFFPVLNIHFGTRGTINDLLCCDVFSYSLKIKGTSVKPSLKFSSALSHPFVFDASNNLSLSLASPNMIGHCELVLFVE